MRLALLYHQFITRGGLEGYLMEFARRLKERGHELDLVTSMADERARTLATRLHLIPPPPLSSTWLLKRFAERSAKMIPVEGTDLTLGFGRTFRQDIHRAGGGCHKVYSRMLPAHKRLRWKNQWELALEERLYTGGETRNFVVNSSRVQEELEEEYGVSRERITIIHTGVDTEYFEPLVDTNLRWEARRKLSLSAENQRVLLFVSLEHRRKGLSALLAALGQVPDAELWVAGESLGWKWKQELARHGVGDRVREFGLRDDLRPFYQSADLFVHPTLYDACANTVLQSMACGLPGVISSRDGARDFVRDGENGWLLHNPEDAAELAGRIAHALNSDLGPIGASARSTMLPLTWSAHVDAWEALMARDRG